MQNPSIEGNLPQVKQIHEISKVFDGYGRFSVTTRSEGMVTEGPSVTIKKWVWKQIVVAEDLPSPLKYRSSPVTEGLP